jgi:hypothetical protein
LPFVRGPPFDLSVMGDPIRIWSFNPLGKHVSLIPRIIDVYGVLIVEILRGLASLSLIWTKGFIAS